MKLNKKLLREMIIQEMSTLNETVYQDPGLPVPEAPISSGQPNWHSIFLGVGLSPVQADSVLSIISQHDGQIVLSADIQAEFESMRERCMEWKGEEGGRIIIPDDDAEEY